MDFQKLKKQFQDTIESIRAKVPEKASDVRDAVTHAFEPNVGLAPETFFLLRGGTAGIS